ncbi:MAG: transposase [Synergistaceae bacterium]|nr:transposase [Synergistaceae bacterium]
MKLSDRVYECPECGLVVDRDYNAAINLKNCEKFATAG